MAILYNPFYCYDLDPALPNKLGGCPLYLFQMGIFSTSLSISGLYIRYL